MSWQPPDQRRELPPDEVHIWRVSLDLTARQRAFARSVLDPDEIRRARRFRSDQRRNRFVASRFALRSILAGYLDVPPAGVALAIRQSGKPCLAGDAGGLEFNLAHSAGTALIAVARTRAVGIDLERLRRDVACERLAERFFADREIATIRTTPPATRAAVFFKLWTRKEAYLKASEGELSRGLPTALSRFSVVSAASVDLAIDVPGKPGEATRWTVVDVDLGPGFAGALVVEGKPRPRWYDWDSVPH